jgi:preprotein translocase subunit SecE
MRPSAAVGLPTRGSATVPVAQITPSGSPQSSPESLAGLGKSEDLAKSEGPGRPESRGARPERDGEESVLVAAPSGFAAATLDELRRVVWPSRQQLFSESVAVILMVGLSAAGIAAIDRFYRWLSILVFR